MKHAAAEILVNKTFDTFANHISTTMLVKSKLFNLADLKASYRRGQGAFLSGGSRRGIPMNAWAMARVNKLISRGRSGTFDTDIIRRASKRKRKK